MIQLVPNDILKWLGDADRDAYKSISLSQGVLGYLKKQNVILQGHFVYSGGGHGDTYVNIRDLVTMEQLIPIAIQMAWECREIERIDGFVGTPHGADTLTTLVAYYYYVLTCNKVEVLKLLKPGGRLEWYKDHDQRAIGMCLVQIEDVINSAKGLQETADYILSSDGTLVGIRAVCNRVSAKNPGLKSLHDKYKTDVAVLCAIEANNYAVSLSDDPSKQCPLCRDGVRMETRYGYGTNFLRKIQDEYPELHRRIT
jgi:orotate phosphoribosyltransferase